jgi:hypothetical protein
MMQEIFRHFSYIFEARQGMNTTSTTQQPYNPLKDHIFLANRVLDIFLQMGLHGDMIDEGTWNHILKIILGVTDSTIRGKQGISELNYGLLKVLFELWLCSLSDDKVMWNHLQTYALQWGKHMATIKQWNSVCIALTQRVINLLYGPTEGTPIVKIQWKGLNQANNPNPNVGNPTTELDLPDEYIYYAWNMFLYVIGNPNRLLDPEIHLKAFQGIQFITKLLAYVGTDPPLAKLKQSTTDIHLPYAPDGNTVLEIFGPWFFEAVNRRLPQFNEGRAVAYAALCRVYCRKGGRPFEKHNLALFYHAIRNGLAEDDVIVISAIILNSCKIFSYELKGSHVLIPHYVRVCAHILSGVEKSKYPEVLRSACITLVSSLICLPNHFAGADESEKNPIYVNLKGQVQSIFLKALQEERATRNIQHVMWSITSLIFEEIHDNQSVAITFIRAMLDLLKNHGAKPMREYTSDVFISIFEVFSALTPLYEYIESADPNVGLSIVDTIALQVPLQLQLLALSPTQTSAKIIEEGLYCICDWVMVGHDRIMPDKDVVSRIISAIEAGLNASKSLGKTTASVQVPAEQQDAIILAAEYLLAHMLNHVSHFPAINDSAQTSTTITEQLEALDQLEGDISDYVRFFILDDMFIVTCIEQPDEKDGPGVTLLIRDVTGKYAWDTRLLFGLPPVAHSDIPDPGQYTGSTSDGLTGHTPEHESNQLFIDNTCTPALKQRDGADRFGDMINQLVGHENEWTRRKREEILDEMDISIKKPKMEYKYDSENKFAMSRALLSHMGFLNLQLRDRFIQLQSNQKLLRSLRVLDGTPSRDTHKIGVVYVATGQDTQQELFTNEGGSELYERFLRSLGWNVDLGSHTGFMGGLDKNGSTGQSAPYFADYKTEITYHVPTMMPTSVKEPQQIHKKRHVGNDHVNVIWTEHTRDYFKNTIVSQFNFVHIVIYPLSNGLFRVDVHTKERNMAVFGPLCDGMIVSEHILGPLVRMTAVNGNRIVRGMSTGYSKPFVSRKHLIQEIAGRYKTKLDISNYYATLFMNKRDAIEISETSAPKKKAINTSKPTTTTTTPTTTTVGKSTVSSTSSNKLKGK